MITFTDFYDSARKLSFYGNIKPSTKLQGYTKNRTIGGKVKQRWLGSFNTFGVEVLVMDRENFEALERMFEDRTLLCINNDGEEKYATIVGDTLSFDEFEDSDGEIYYRGNLELES